MSKTVGEIRCKTMHAEFRPEGCGILRTTWINRESAELSRTPHAFQNTRLRRQSPRNAVCKNETEKSAEFCVYSVGLHHCRTVSLQNSTSRIVSEISAGFCISRPKLTIRKSPLSDSKKVIKKRSSITMFRKTRTWGKKTYGKIQTDTRPTTICLLYTSDAADE